MLLQSSPINPIEVVMHPFATHRPSASSQRSGLTLQGLCQSLPCIYYLTFRFQRRNTIDTKCHGQIKEIYMCFSVPVLSIGGPAESRYWYNRYVLHKYIHPFSHVAWSYKSYCHRPSTSCTKTIATSNALHYVTAVSGNFFFSMSCSWGSRYFGGSTMDFKYRCRWGHLTPQS